MYCFITVLQSCSTGHGSRLFSVLVSRWWNKFFPRCLNIWVTPNYFLRLILWCLVWSGRAWSWDLNSFSFQKWFLLHIWWNFPSIEQLSVLLKGISLQANNSGSWIYSILPTYEATGHGHSLWNISGALGEGTWSQPYHTLFCITFPSGFEHGFIP